MPYSLPRSSPVNQRVDPAVVLAFLDAMDARPDIEMHSFMLVRHGHVVAEGWWRPYTAARVHLLYSLSKSFTSTAAAFAKAEGLLDLDDTIIKHFPEFESDITDPNSRAMRIRHVASMASGHERETIAEALKRDPQEGVRGFLLIPPGSASRHRFRVQPTLHVHAGEQCPAQLRDATHGLLAHAAV